MSLPEIKIEKFTDWYEEAKPIFSLHWEEIANYTDQVELNPDYDLYIRKEKEGSLLCLTVRHDGKLIGYSMFSLITLGHYKQVKCAQNDILYILPEYRKGGLGSRLINRSEEICKELRLNKIMWHVKFKHDWSAILVRKGYMKEDMIIGKVL